MISIHLWIVLVRLGKCNHLLSWNCCSASWFLHGACVVLLSSKCDYKHPIHWRSSISSSLLWLELHNVTMTLDIVISGGLPLKFRDLTILTNQWLACKWVSIWLWIWGSAYICFMNLQGGRLNDCIDNGGPSLHQSFYQHCNYMYLFNLSPFWLDIQSEF